MSDRRRPSRRSLRVLLVALGVSGTLVFVGAPAAHAQTQTALAETLFQTAKKLMADGDYARRLPEARGELSPRSGKRNTLGTRALLRGSRQDGDGLGVFTDVAAAAKQENRSDREVIARTHIASLEPKLSRLVIDVAPVCCERVRPRGQTRRRASDRGGSMGNGGAGRSRRSRHPGVGAGQEALGVGREPRSQGRQGEALDSDPPGRCGRGAAGADVTARPPQQQRRAAEAERRSGSSSAGWASRRSA